MASRGLSGISSSVCGRLQRAIAVEQRFVQLAIARGPFHSWRHALLIVVGHERVMDVFAHAQAIHVVLVVLSSRSCQSSLARALLPASCFHIQPFWLFTQKRFGCTSTSSEQWIQCSCVLCASRNHCVYCDLVRTPAHVIFSRLAHDLSHRVKNRCVSQNSHSSHQARHVARALIVVSFTLEHYLTFHMHSSPTFYPTIYQTFIDVYFTRISTLRRSIECVFRFSG